MTCCGDSTSTIPADDALLPKLLVLLLKTNDLGWAEDELRTLARNYWVMQEVMDDDNDKVIPTIERAVIAAVESDDPQATLKAELDDLDLLYWRASYGDGEGYTEWNARREPLDVFMARAKQLGMSVIRWQDSAKPT